MSQYPQYVYKPSEQAVYKDDGDTVKQVYSGVSKVEFETLESVDTFLDGSVEILRELQVRLVV